MKKTREHSPWLNDQDKIASASDDSLLRSILTSDGKGSAFKEKVLEEILRRNSANNRAVKLQEKVPIPLI